MVIERYEGVVSSIAYEFSRKFRMVETSDLRQELWIWFLTHPRKITHWEKELDSKQCLKLVARSLRNAAKDYCQREKAKSVGYRVEDLYYYDKELVEALLPAVLTGDRNAPKLTDLGYSNVKKVASEGNNWFAMCADIEKAFSKLIKEQQVMLHLRYANGLELGTIASELSLSQDAVRMRINRALSNILNKLGGYYPRKERDYRDEEEAKSETTSDTTEEDSNGYDSGIVADDSGSIEGQDVD